MKMREKGTGKKDIQNGENRLGLDSSNEFFSIANCNSYKYYQI